MNKFINPTDIELKDEVVIAINRVSKATNGGRRMRFNCIVCVGDGAGHVGIGFGKANEVASAVNKSKENAMKNLDLWKRIDLKYKLFKKKDIDKIQWKAYKQKVKSYKLEVKKSLSALISIASNIKKLA